VLPYAANAVPSLPAPTAEATSLGPEAHLRPHGTVSHRAHLEATVKAAIKKSGPDYTLARPLTTAKRSHVLCVHLLAGKVGMRFPRGPTSSGCKAHFLVQRRKNSGHEAAIVPNTIRRCHLVVMGSLTWALHLKLRFKGQAPASRLSHVLAV